MLGDAFVNCRDRVLGRSKLWLAEPGVRPGAARLCEVLAGESQKPVGMLPDPWNTGAPSTLPDRQQSPASECRYRRSASM